MLDHWPVVSANRHDRFTTVASWRGPYGPVEATGRRLGLKVHSFRRVLELPRLVPGRFELALDIDPADAADRQRLVDHGWRLAEARDVACDPARFRSYVQRSGAEFSVAQEIYVKTGSGWFSDRTTRYLASGKPAVVQDTGFSQHIPVGEGLLAFHGVDDAAAACAAVLADYPRHCAAARALAEEHFSPARALGGLLEDVGVAP
jgi:hypothetical protein